MPSKLPQFQVDKLDSRATEIIEWMKIALEADNVYPVNPNLVTSGDDSTIFTIEGVQGRTGDWEWKIVGTVNKDSSVRSDFKVQGENEISGGLWIRLTFTLSASGLSAPPYTTVSGLSKEELCPILCPDGILAVKVPGLCKGVDNVGNDSDFGWLVFMRGGQNDTDSELSMANKKFMHYNNDVYMSRIRKLRKKLGWVEGQPVPESLKAVSCGATTISPSCKPCCSSLERQRT